MTAPEVNSPHPREQAFATFGQAAPYWFDFGLRVIPIVPHSKRPPVTWDTWINGLSHAKIGQHWSRFPDHEIGFIVGDEIIVFDADSQESIEALNALERKFYAAPKIVVKTSKGEHHYFSRAEGTYAKSDSHSTEKYPDRIDVKTGRSIIILPPSTGKIVDTCVAENASDLNEASQDFIDAIFVHNGRTPPRQPEITTSSNDGSVTYSQNLARLKALLALLDPESGGYENWLHCLMAVFHETKGSEDGFAIANKWSSNGNSYKGENEIRAKWNSFKSGTANPITIGTLIKMAQDQGADLTAIYTESSEQFEVVETEVIAPTITQTLQPVALDKSLKVDTEKRIVPVNPLEQYSLRGMSDEMEKNVVEAVPLLDEIALMGQATAYFAKPNVGKSAITFKLLIDAIMAGRVDPENVYYLDMDDTATGLVEKNRIAEEYGFHMLAEGHRDFSAGEFKSIVRDLIENDQAKGIVLILDTLKKFVNLMDKVQTSTFTNVIRPFVSKGGTVIALAHTNKNPGKDGKPVYGGVSDIMNDIDCAYTIEQISAENGVKVVEFVNVKRRGNVVQSASYSYCIDNKITYNELLASVQPVAETQLEPIKQVEAIKADAEVIGSVIACISDGICSKMKLADAAAKRTDVSNRAAIRIIEKYTGDDPVLHRWKFTVGDRGAKIYVVLNSPKPEQGLEEPKN